MSIIIFMNVVNIVILLTSSAARDMYCIILSVLPFFISQLGVKGRGYRT